MLAVKVADDGLVELVVDGDVTRADFDGVVTTLEAEFTKRSKVPVVEVVHKIGKLAPHLWWKDVKWSFGHLDRFGRCAMVAKPGWVGPVARAMATLLPIELRTFKISELDAARAWARGLS